MNTTLVALLLFAIGLLARLFLAYGFRGNFDQQSYEIVARIVRAGGNVYQQTPRYNYSPLWFYFLHMADMVTQWVGLPLHFVVRSFLSLVDMANGALAALIARDCGLPWTSFRRLTYWINPVAILIVGFHGQFETLAILPLLVATYLYVHRGGQLAIRWIWLLGTASLLIKHNTVFAIWMLFFCTVGWWRAGLMLAASIGVFLLSFLPFWAAGATGIVDNVFRYQSTRIDVYGFGDLLPTAPARIIFFAVMTILPVIAKHYLHLTLPRSMEFSFVALLTFIYGIGEQFFLLPVIWGSIFGRLSYGLYTAVACVFLLGSPDNMGFRHFPVWWNSVWLIAAGWFASYFIKRQAPVASTARESVDRSRF